MSLKDRVNKDIARCFMNTDHFASAHYWNGNEIICVTDDEEALKRKNNNVNGISWDNNTREILIHTPIKNFPGGEPEPNTHVMFDNRSMRVSDIVCNEGVLGITLVALDPREMM